MNGAFLVMRPEGLTMLATDSRTSGAARALTSSPRRMAAIQVALQLVGTIGSSGIQKRIKLGPIKTQR